MKRIIDIIRHRKELRKEVSGPVEKTQLVLIILMQVAFLGAIALSIYEKSWIALFIAILALIAVWLPSALEKNFDVHLPLEFEFILNLFIYGSIFLGEIHGFYTLFWWWDVVLHAMSGVAFGFIGFLILFSLYKSKRFQASPFLIAVFAFSFALALGTLWEIFEFFMDSFFALNMQKSGLVDTMTDLIVNAVGAIVVSISGYAYMKNRKTEHGVFHHFLTKYLKQ
jgi:hypothetical protein